MLRYLVMVFVLLSIGTSEPGYVDGILVDPPGYIPTGRQFNVIDSFPSAAPSYSQGLAFDGQYLWNDEGFSHWFARMDTATGSVVNTFTPTYGNRDMTFDGQYLWASDWQTSSINQYDTSDCSIIATYYPPFSAGRPNGMAWDGTHLWVGEESGRIYQMTRLDDTVRSIPPPFLYSYEPRGLAFDGEYLWVGYQDANMIYKVDTIDGTIHESYSAPGAAVGFQQGLTFDGQYLWSTSGVRNWIYKIDIELAVEEFETDVRNRISIANHPNPFVRETKINFSIQKKTTVCLSIIDAVGKIISRPLDQTLAPGNYTIALLRNDLQAGVYFAVLETDEGATSTKLIILD